MEIRILFSAIAIVYLVYILAYKGKEMKDLIKVSGIFVLILLLLPNLLAISNNAVKAAVAVDPGISGLVVHFLGAFLATVIYFILKPKLNGVIRFLATLIVVTIFMFSVIQYFTISVDKNDGLLLINIFVSILILFTVFNVVTTWNNTGRVTFGVAATYALNVVLTLIITYIYGYCFGFILKNSSVAWVSTLALQLIFLWLSCVIDPQEKNLRKRKSYWINKLWMFGNMVAFIAILKPLLLGEITTEEILINRDVNYGKAVYNQLITDQALVGYNKDDKTSVIMEMDEAYEARDLNKAQALIQKSENARARLQSAKQQKLKPDTPDAIIPDKLIKEGISGTLSGSSNAIDWLSAELEKQFPPKPPSPNGGQISLPEKVYDAGPHTIILKAGETLDHVITYPNYPANQRYNTSISSDDNNFFVCFVGGSKYLIKDTKEIPFQNVAKYTIRAVTDQKITLVVTPLSRS